MNANSVSIRNLWFDWDETSRTVSYRLPQMDAHPLRLETMDDLRRLIRLATGMVLPTDDEGERSDYRFVGGEFHLWDDVAVAADNHGNHLAAWRAQDLVDSAWDIVCTLAYVQHHHST